MPDRVPDRVPTVSRDGSGQTRVDCVTVSPPITPLGGPGDTVSEPAATVSPNRVPHPADTGRSTWLLTPRCQPAWIAVLNLLDDDQWHPTTEVAQVMRDTASLAHSTITNHLRQAGRRRWISTKRGRTRLRNRDLIEAALDALDDRP